MKLTELEPQFIKYVKGDDGHVYLHHVNTLSDADGIMFLSPIAFVVNKGPVGTYYNMVFFKDKGAPPDMGKNKDGQTVRWAATGTGYEDLTLEPSILEQGGLIKLENGEVLPWHGWVRNGEVTNA